MLTTRKQSTWLKKSWSLNWGAWHGWWANLSTASWYWIEYIDSNRLILIRNLDYYAYPHKWHISTICLKWNKFPAMYYITTIKLTYSAILNKGELGEISFQMTETYVSKHVAKMAVRVVQRDFGRVSTSGLGESRAYNGSRLLKLVTGLSISGICKAHIKVAEDLYYEIKGDREKVDHWAHKGGWHG